MRGAHPRRGSVNPVLVRPFGAYRLTVASGRRSPIARGCFANRSISQVHTRVTHEEMMENSYLLWRRRP
jgi:hypothetical protein